MADSIKRLGDLDLCFMVDNTSSMGPYIETVKQKILEIIQTIRMKEMCSSLRVGLVRYRDHPPEDRTFVTKTFPFEENAEKIKNAVLEMQAEGGGDGPEAVVDAIFEVNCLKWREKAAKIVIWMGDAPPHGVEPSGDSFKHGCPCKKDWKKESKKAYNKGILIYPVGCFPEISRYQKAIDVYKEVANITKGTFIPLEKAQLLVSLITGVAESELEKLKIEEMVVKEIQRVRAAAPSMKISEAEIEEKVFANLEEQDVSLKSYDHIKAAPASAPVGAKDLKLKERKLNKEDVKEALRQVKLKKLDEKKK